jgi:hypothetical protein
MLQGKLELTIKINEPPLVKEITKDTEGLALPAFAYKPPDFTNEESVEMIRFLPDHVMEDGHGILLGSGNTLEDKDNQFAQIIRKQYDYTADWLEYYVLNNTEKLLELTNPETEKHYYKPFAEQSLATLKLIKEVCAFCRWLNADNLCINRWWLACEWELCDQALEKSGYTGNPLLIGASQAYKSVVSLGKEWDSSNINTVSAEILQTTSMQALQGLAWAISEHRDNYAFRFHFDCYKKILKREWRSLRDSKLNPTYMVDGQIHLMQRGKPGQKRL